MPKEIKTRNVVKNIKTLDKTANLGSHMKNAFVRSKETAEHTQDSGYNSPSEYATDNVSGHANGIAQNTVLKTRNKLKHPYQKMRNRFQQAKGHFNNIKKQTPKERQRSAEQAKNTADAPKSKAKEMQKTAKEANKSVTDAKRTLKQIRQTGRQSIQAAKTGKTMKQFPVTSDKTIKTAKSAGKGSIKTIKQSVKTSERTAKTTVKTAKQTAKTAQRSAQAAAKAAKIAAKNAEKAAKTATKAITALIKSAIAAVKGLVTLIAMGGWIAVIIIIIVCLIGLLCGSIFGIFFFGEDSGAGRSMTSVVTELTDEFYEKVEDIKNQHTYDVLDIGSVSINWSEILSVYAVKINSDPNNPTEIATIDDNKFEALHSIFDDMTDLSYILETEEQETTTTDDAGNETIESVTITTLVITLTQKSTDDMALQCGFSTSQKELLTELLKPEYSDMWAALLVG